MSKLKTLSNKSAVEIVPIIFDYANLISTSIDSVVSVGIAPINGTDPGATAMLLGTAVISGLKVVQLLQNGINGVSYKITCLVAKGSERYQIEGIITIS